MSFRVLVSLVAASVLAVGTCAAATPTRDELSTDGDFETIKNSAQLRRDDEGRDWHESRRQSRQARELLLLSKKSVAKNRTQKAMIKAHPELNTYLSQELAAPQEGRFRVTFEICIKQIRPEYNRSAFFFAGTSSDKKNGPNSTGVERFVFLGWENGDREGKVNLFARQGLTGWEERTLLAKDLDLMTWYKVTIDVDTAAGTYSVKVGTAPASEPLAAFATRGAAVPQRITHISFASWNDGAGTFYVDNVSARPR
ncbi:MAG: hypothetical protein PHQ53_01855 [Candidatus Krumholzibacteria bacterium]|nr:hypothetical protein [Candidatus Krumholzibacteria bacterium]